MTDISQSDHGDLEPSKGTDEANQDISGQEVPPGMLPLVEPVFGKRAFWITAAPFIVYLLGTMLGSHFEHNRKVSPLHSLRGSCRSLSESFRQQFGDPKRYPKEDADKIFKAIGLASVQEALNDESSEFAVLVQGCDKLRTVDIESLPYDSRESVKQFQMWITGWLEIQEYEETGELEKIIPAIREFRQKVSPEAEPLKLDKSFYPTLYSIACIAALIAVIVALPGYLKHPFRISPFAIGVGGIGIIVWLGLWWLDDNFLHLGHMMAPNSRAAFNPFKELGPPTPTWWLYTFIGIRLLGLCIVIPIAEEFFARGFLMRYIEDIDWDQIPLGEATWKGLAGIIVYGAMTHPGEILAAVAWFGLITWMYLKTKNIWDCVVAHAVTNGLLAAFVLATGTWELW